MYPDPKRVRSFKHTVYLDEYEVAIIQAHANYSGLPLAAVMRDMMMKAAQESLGLSPNASSKVAGRAR